MISIIVPVYKAEKYLHRCIDSILAQSYTDFELLLINDGSPDKSGQICDSYAAKDSRVLVFHKANRGVSSARNLGLENARGEWVTFIDSDDWVKTEFLEKMPINLDIDLCVGGNICSSGSYIKLQDKQYDRKIITNFLKQYLPTQLLHTVWGKLLKREIIIRNNIRFNEDIRFGEDTLFIYQYLCHCNSIMAVSYCGYNYMEATVGWVQNSRKYKLSLSEIDVSLNKIIIMIQKLSERFCYSFDIETEIYIFFSMYSTINFIDEGRIEEYKNLCQKYMPQLDDSSFYCSHLYSPILRGIMELKCCYEDGLYDEGKELFPILYTISRFTPPKTPLVYKDFYLWEILIRHKAFGLCHILLQLYLNIKSLSKH